MFSWKVRQVSSSEYHVIETRYVGDQEFVLAKCSGPVPAGEIVLAMRVFQALQSHQDTIHNAIVGIDSALKVFDAEMAAAKQF